MPPDVGPAVVLVCQFLLLLPHYYQLNTLLVLGRKDEEWTFRSSLLQCNVLAVVVEVLWSALHPATLPFRVCSFAVLAYVLLQSLHLGLAFAAPAGAYHYGVAFPLQMATNLALIPVTQVGNNSTLRRRVSPARYKMRGTLASVLIAVVPLCWPSAAGPRLAVLSSALPALAAAALLWLAAETEAQAQDTSEKASEKAAGTGKYAQLVDASLSERICPEFAAAFLALGCVAGTTGESLMDVATTLAIRKSLQAGSQDLALTNQCTIFVSVSLAYFSEARAGGSAARRGNLFVFAWAGCQLFRGAALHLLQTGSLGVPLLAVFAFLDKYTGPLGTVALDNALLRLLKAGAAGAQERLTVPSTLLWTARMVVTKVERPICQLVLLHTSGIPVHRVAWLLTAATCLAVVAANSDACCRGKSGRNGLKEE